MNHSDLHKALDLKTDLVEISREEVIKKVRAWAEWRQMIDGFTANEEDDLLAAVTLLESREQTGEQT